MNQVVRKVRAWPASRPSERLALGPRSMRPSVRLALPYLTFRPPHRSPAARLRQSQLKAATERDRGLLFTAANTNESKTASKIALLPELVPRLNVPRWSEHQYRQYHQYFHHHQRQPLVSASKHSIGEEGERARQTPRAFIRHSACSRRCIWPRRRRPLLPLLIPGQRDKAGQEERRERE